MKLAKKLAEFREITQNNDGRTDGIPLASTALCIANSANAL